MPDDQDTINCQQEIAKAFAKIGASLNELSNHLRFNPGNKNCSHEWKDAVRPCSWMQDHPLIAMQICQKCPAERIRPGSTVTSPGGEGYSSAEVLLDKNGWPGGYLET